MRLQQSSDPRVRVEGNRLDHLLGSTEHCEALQPMAQDLDDKHQLNVEASEEKSKGQSAGALSGHWVHKSQVGAFISRACELAAAGFWPGSPQLRRSRPPFPPRPSFVVAEKDHHLVERSTELPLQGAFCLSLIVFLEFWAGVDWKLPFKPLVGTRHRWATGKALYLLFRTEQKAVTSAGVWMGVEGKDGG